MMYNVAERYQHFAGTCCVHPQDKSWRNASPKHYQTPDHRIPEVYDLSKMSAPTCVCFDVFMEVRISGLVGYVV
jgi:hypothetical protein